MANMKTCKACRTPNEIGAVLCDTCCAAEFELETAGSQPGGPREAPAMAGPGPGTVVLEWPWADSPVTGQLAIGREESFSPIAQYLDPYDNVSRQHAEVVVREGTVTVRDLGSMNGTFVNGNRIAGFDRVPLESGDELQFGRDLTARVRIVR